MLRDDDPRTTEQIMLDSIGFTPSKRAEVLRTGERAPISRLVRQLVYKRDRWTCQNCGDCPFAAAKDRRSGPLHLDHIKPWSAGGSDRSDNLRTLCEPCNMQRSNYVTGQEVAALPIVRICAPCLTLDGAEKPAAAFTVYCGCRHHEGWAIPGWSIL